MTCLNKKLTLLIFALIFEALLYTAGSCEEAQRPKEFKLTLKEAILTAFNNNKDIKRQEQDLYVSSASIVDARSNFIPKANLQAAYKHNDSVISLNTPTAKKDIGVAAGYKNDNLIGVTIDETISNGGANIANYNQAKLGLKVSEETLRAKKLDVEFETKRLYYGLLLAYETERIAKDLVGQAISHYEDVESKFGQGTSSRFDLLQSKVQISKLMPELVKASNNIDLIKVELVKLLGLKMRDSVEAGEHLAYSLIDIREEEFLKEAYLNKPEMILDSLGVDINKWSIQMAKAGWRPQVNASAGYLYRSNDIGDMLNSRHNNWSAGFSVTIPIFDAWSTKAKVDEAKAKYAQAILKKEDLSDQICVDVRSACLDLKEAKTIIDSQKDNISEAKEALRISIVRYDNGVGTNLDVLDSQVSLAQVEQNLAEGIYDYLMAGAYLDRTRGRSFLGEEKNEKKI